MKQHTDSLLLCIYINLGVLNCSCSMTWTINVCNSGSTGSLDMKKTKIVTLSWDCFSNCTLLQTLSALPRPQPALSFKVNNPTTLFCEFPSRLGMELSQPSIPLCHLPAAFPPATPLIWVKHLHKSQEQNHMPLKQNKQKQTLDQL